MVAMHEGIPATGVRGARPRVALAEDDAGLRQVVAETLRESGIEVVEAADGGSLIGVLGRGQVSLVITDLMMPGLRGDDVLRLYRTLGDEIPFIVITAASTAVVDAVRLSSNVIVLRKPFTVETLLETITHVLGDASASDHDEPSDQA